MTHQNRNGDVCRADVSADVSTDLSIVQVSRAIAAFSLIELLIVMLIMGIIATLGLPALNKLIMRSKLEGQARSLSVMAGRARNEAVTQGAETVVHLDGDEFVAFVDLDGVASTDPPDGLFNPVAGAEYKTTDWEMARLPLANKVTVTAPTGEDAISGLVNTNRPDERIIFNPDGTLLSTGGFRLADPAGNFLELAVGPRATGQVTLRKWDGAAWREQDEGGESWDWN